MVLGPNREVGPGEIVEIADDEVALLVERGFATIATDADDGMRIPDRKPGSYVNGKDASIVDAARPPV